ncbi:hypothetical protein ACQP1U_12490 [Actinomycetota bacterium]|nr:hypothetical protein [Micrococcales bacterium]
MTTTPAITAAAAALAERRHLLAILPSVRAEAALAETECTNCHERLTQEMRDVRRLQQLSLGRLWAKASRSLEDDVAREEAEAEEAGLRYREAERARDLAAAELERVVTRLRDLEDAEDRWATAVSAATASDATREWAEAEFATLRQRRQIDEALTAGGRADAYLLEALKALDEAQDLAGFDTLVGGGFGALTAMGKHQQMNLASGGCVRRSARSGSSAVSSVTCSSRAW